MEYIDAPLTSGRFRGQVAQHGCCRADVRLTRELFLLGCRQGHLLFHNKAGQTVRVPVGWRRFVVAPDGDGQAPDLQKEPQ